MCHKAIVIALVANFTAALVKSGPAEAQSTDGVFSVGGQAVAVDTVAAGLNRPWGLAFLPNGDLLVSTKNGGLWRLKNGQGPAISIAGLPDDLDVRLESPIDNTGLFDVAVDPNYSSTRRIFLSYASAGTGGAALKVSSFRLADDALSPAKELLLAGPRSSDRFHYGGGLLPLDDGTLLVTTGERFAFEKPQGDAPVAQNLSDPRGKILRINFDGSVPADNPFVGKEGIDKRIYALGSRNAQGIARASDGTIWFSEHGPRAGDELNRLVSGANYGWPLVTCGAYKDRDYEPPVAQGLNLSPPAACWSEATYAPAGLAFYTADAFPAWRGKLLMAGLSRGRLLLLTMQESGPPLIDSLFPNDPQRLRDVAVAPNGTVYLAVDGENGRIVRLSPSNARSVQGSIRGVEVWSTCMQCHTVETQAHDGLIPLAGLIGRAAASSVGVEYSNALKASGLTWSEETLDKFLAEPGEFVPGTTMPVQIADVDERQAIIEYLKRLGAQPH